MNYRGAVTVVAVFSFSTLMMPTSLSASQKITGGGVTVPITGDVTSCSPLAAGKVVKVRLNKILDDLNSKTEPRDLGVSTDPGDDDDSNVDRIPADADWPTSLDVQLQKNWFKKSPQGNYVTIQYRLLSGATDADSAMQPPETDFKPRNEKVSFLVAKPDPLDATYDPTNSDLAVRAGAENPQTICGKSKIYTLYVHNTKQHKWRRFSVVDVYVKPKAAMLSAVVGLNIGLLVGPFTGTDGTKSYMPIYLDPKVHNDGNP